MNRKLTKKILLVSFSKNIYYWFYNFRIRRTRQRSYICNRYNPDLCRLLHQYRASFSCTGFPYDGYNRFRTVEERFICQIKNPLEIIRSIILQYSGAQCWQALYLHNFRLSLGGRGEIDHIPLPKRFLFRIKGIQTQ